MSEQRERVFNAPAAVVALVAILVAAFLAQAHFGVQAMADVWGFAPSDLSRGRYVTLLTAMLLHGGWLHLLGNCVFALAFATPVARRLGEDGRGVLAFFGLYLLCGLIGNLGYWAVNPGGAVPEIGASGAIAGMMGAASRLIGQPPGELAPYRSRTVIAMAASWVVANVVFGLIFIGWAPGSGGAPIAWQVHLAGYAAGLLLFGPLLSVMGRRQIDHGIEN
jgi:membrane associated rhomboid family serine protease